MKFKPLFLFENVEVGKDRLNNPVYELKETDKGEGRFSTWTAEEIALDVRNVTVSNRKIITRLSKVALLKADKINFEGLYHDITDIKGSDDDRWRILIVNRYGSDDL